jgi:OmpA-OmpF porin, OOP family
MLYNSENLIKFKELKLKKIVVSTCACLVLSTIAMAEYKIEPVTTKSFTKNSSAMDDYSTVGVRVSKELVDALSLRLGFEYSDDAEYKGSNHTTDISKYVLDAVYDFKNSTNFTPFIFVGGGYEKVNNKKNDFDSQAIWNGGLGLSYALTDVVSLFTEAKYTHKVETEDKDKTIGLGISMKFGGEKPAPVQIQEEIKPQPKEVVKQAEPKKVIAPLDGDKDGVIDELDKCPQTPKGLAVDKDGCALKFNFQVNFDFDQKTIKPEYMTKVEEFATIMKENPLLNATIEGHTDSIGTDAYNNTLSTKRANAVRDALIAKGIDANRLTAVGMGESQPVADNHTKDGRAENRRVEANTDIK